MRFETDTPLKAMHAQSLNAVGMISKTDIRNLDPVLGPTGLDLLMILDPLNEEPLQSYCKKFQSAVPEGGFFDLGFEFGRDFHPKLLGLIGYAAILAPTLGSCLRTLTEHLPVDRSYSNLQLEEDGEQARLTFEINDTAVERSRQAAEFYFGLFYNAIRACLGAEWQASEIWLEHGKPLNEHSKLDEAFGAPIRLGQPKNAIVFPRADLEAPIPNADRHLSTFLQDAFLQKQRFRVMAADFVVEMCKLIRARLGHSSPTLEAIADDMGVSKWVLRGRLKAHGIQFVDLITTTRKELAREYLSQPDMPLTEIALLLGYSELSAFSRAFRQWTGASPQQYRKKLFSADK